MFEYFMTLFRVYKVYIFYLSIYSLVSSLPMLFMLTLYQPEKVEASIIFDEIIDRDDVSGWIDRDNYFTLSLFNVSLGKIIFQVMIINILFYLLKLLMSVGPFK